MEGKCEREMGEGDEREYDERRDMRDGGERGGRHGDVATVVTEYMGRIQRLAEYFFLTIVVFTINWDPKENYSTSKV